MVKGICLRILLIILLVQISFSSFSQIMNWQEEHRASFYFSFGYGLQSYKNSTIHITQNSLNNDFNIVNALGTDKGNGDFKISGSRMSYHFGYFFNANQNDGIEISSDPCKYYLQDNQLVTIKGTIQGNSINKLVNFSRLNGDNYGLNAGNIFMLSFVKRIGLYRKITHKISIDFIGKIGGGIIQPTVNYKLNESNYPNQKCIAGTNLGISAGLRIVSHKYFFADVSYKYNYAQLSNITIYQGAASQNLTSTEISFGLGVLFPLGRHNPLFLKGWLHHRKIKPHPMYKGEEDY